MMPYTVAQAAKAIGKSKATVFRAISAGRISAGRDEATGAFLVDPSELHRIFAPVSHDALHDTPNGAIRDGDDTVAIRELRARFAEKDALIAVHERTIEDLRRRLDAEAEERRRLTAILADQRAAPAPIRRWWRFGR